jgi:hypothetical protein
MADLVAGRPLWLSDPDRTPMGRDVAARYRAAPLGEQLAAYSQDDLARRSVRHVERQLDRAELTGRLPRPWTADTTDIAWQPGAPYATGPDAEYPSLPPTQETFINWAALERLEPAERSRALVVARQQFQDQGVAELARRGQPDGRPYPPERLAALGRDTRALEQELYRTRYAAETVSGPVPAGPASPPPPTPATPAPSSEVPSTGQAAAQRRPPRPTDGPGQRGEPPP